MAHNPKVRDSNPLPATKNPHGKPLCGFSLAILPSQFCCSWDFFARWEEVQQKCINSGRFSVRFGLLQFCCSPVFCREKFFLLWSVPTRFLCPRQETAHPVDGFPLFIVQHMGILLSGNDRGMAHEVLDDADRDILLHQSGGEGVPLRYNKDKSENPLFSRLLRC